MGGERGEYIILAGIRPEKTLHFPEQSHIGDIPPLNAILEPPLEENIILYIKTFMKHKS